MKGLQLSYVGLLALSAIDAAASSARADIPVPEPVALFGKDQSPSGYSIAIAGTCLSLAIVVGGMLLVRRSKLVVPVGAATLVLVIGATVAAALLAQRDRTAWEQWKQQEISRQQNWRPPPHLEQPDPQPTAEAELP